MTLLTQTGFADYRRRVFDLYGEKRFIEALAVAQEASKKFPEYDAKTSFWVACLQSRLGDYDDVVQTLENATRRGVWWAAVTLQDSDLDPVRERPDFKRVEEDCKRLHQNAPKTATPELMIRVPSSYSRGGDWPALVAFHARYGERPEISNQEWLSIVSSGIILGAPWSSQVYAWDGRCWDNLEQSETDVKWTFSELKARCRVDSEKLVLGGFSQGGALSIYSALRRLVPCRGFVAVAPSDWVRPEEKTAMERKGLSEPFANFVRASDCRGLRGVIITGDKDAFFPKIKQLYALMLDGGLDGKMLVEPGLGHDYPKDFEGKLKTAVDFVLENSMKAQA